jgi:hypothetical protein
MLGVTVFGIFLTPVFYYVIQWLSDLRGRTAVESVAAADLGAAPAAEGSIRPPHDGTGFTSRP